MDATARKPYPSDLTDEQWALLDLFIPEAEPRGRPRSVNMREVINALLYLNRSGCQWDMLPHDLPPKSTASCRRHHRTGRVRLKAAGIVEIGTDRYPFLFSAFRQFSRPNREPRWAAQPGAVVSTPTLAPAITATARRPRLITGFLFTLIVIHVLAVFAFLPYTFTWWGVASLLLGNFIFGSIGINLAYHRMLTHSAVMFPKWMERLFILCGVCSLEGSPLWWVLQHRIHHQKSDEAGDPHSPQEHFLWGHMQWIYTAEPERNRLSTYEKYVPDLMTDPFLRWLHRGQKWVLVYIAHALLIAAAGFGIGFLVADTTERAVQIGVQVFLWGVVVRTVYVWHITWFVNSAAHRWGYRNYDTPDKSRNNWWVALLTNGEGWHNNHHAAPRTCSQGHKWWEMDLTYTFVRVLELVGLAKSVVPVKVASYRQKEENADPAGQ